MENLFWVLSKLLWVLVSPETLVLLLLSLGTILLWTERKTAGRRLVTLGAFIVLAVSFLPLDTLLLRPLEERFPAPSALPDTVKGIIVLSGSEQAAITSARGQPSMNEGAERLTAFVALARRYPDARLIHTGGSGALYQQEYPATETARKIFRQLGLNPDRVQFDSRARNTFENAVNSIDLAGENIQGDWILITSAFHMPRAAGVFRKTGWNVIAYPVDYRTTGQMKYDWNLASLDNFFEVTHGLHEWAGLIVYWMTGKSAELFPGPDGAH